MELVVRAFPVAAGDRSRAQALARQMREQPRETAAFYRRYGVSRETWHLQQMPDGSLLLIAVAQLPQKSAQESGYAYKMSREPFDTWLKEQVLAVTGVDLNSDPLGPKTQCIYDSGESL